MPTLSQVEAMLCVIVYMHLFLFRRYFSAYFVTNVRRDNYQTSLMVYHMHYLLGAGTVMR